MIDGSVIKVTELKQVLSEQAPLRLFGLIAIMVIDFIDKIIIVKIIWEL